MQRIAVLIAAAALQCGAVTPADGETIRSKPFDVSAFDCERVVAAANRREIVAVPVTKLHRTSMLPFESLVVVEPLAIGAHAVERAQVEAGEWVLVVGVGPIGLAVVQFAMLASARVIVTDRSPERLAVCTRLHPTVRTLPSQQDEDAAVRETTGGDGPTVVFDATGRTERRWPSCPTSSPIGAIRAPVSSRPS